MLDYTSTVKWTNEERTKQPRNQPINQTRNQPTNEPTNERTNQATNQRTNGLLRIAALNVGLHKHSKMMKDKTRWYIGCLQIQPNKFPVYFQDTFLNKIPVVFTRWWPHAHAVSWSCLPNGLYLGDLQGDQSPGNVKFPDGPQHSAC